MRIHFWNLGKGSHSNKKLQSAFSEYGYDAFGHGIIESSDSPIELEQVWLDSVNPVDNGFNIERNANSPPPRRGHVYTQEEREARSVALKGRTSPMKGRKQTDKARAKISNSLKGTIFSASRKKNISAALTGKSPSDITRKKISETLTGFRHSASSRKNMSLGQLRRRMA